ncbi:CopG family transcriptional regulator, partial [Arthrospira platensis SPKY1]|nr:CopG family transcriptional regulator [Arthrospira platensis SPKY1]
MLVGQRALNVSPRQLLLPAWCPTMYDMKSSALTIRLDPDLERLVARVAKRTGRSRSEVVRDAVRRQLALAEFQ